MAIPSDRLGRGLRKAREAFLVVDGGRRSGRQRERTRRQLTEELVRRFTRLKGSNIDPDAEVAIRVVKNDDGSTAVKVLTFGEIAEAIVDAGWKPPKER